MYECPAYCEWSRAAEKCYDKVVTPQREAAFDDCQRACENAQCTGFTTSRYVKDQSQTYSESLSRSMFKIHGLQIQKPLLTNYSLPIGSASATNLVQCVMWFHGACSGTGSPGWGVPNAATWGDQDNNLWVMDESITHLPVQVRFLQNNAGAFQLVFLSNDQKWPESSYMVLVLMVIVLVLSALVLLHVLLMSFACGSYGSVQYFQAVMSHKKGIIPTMIVILSFLAGLILLLVGYGNAFRVGADESIYCFLTALNVFLNILDVRKTNLDMYPAALPAPHVFVTFVWQTWLMQAEDVLEIVENGVIAHHCAASPQHLEGTLQNPSRDCPRLLCLYANFGNTAGSDLSYSPLVRANDDDDEEESDDDDDEESEDWGRFGCLHLVSNVVNQFPLLSLTTTAVRTLWEVFVLVGGNVDGTSMLVKILMTCGLSLVPTYVIARQWLTNKAKYGTFQFFRHNITIRKNDPWMKSLFITFGSTWFYCWAFYAVSWLYWKPRRFGGSNAQFDYDLPRYFELTSVNVLCMLANLFQFRKPTENLYPPTWEDVIPLKLERSDAIVSHDQMMERVENAYIACRIGHTDRHLRKIVREADWHHLDALYSKFGTESMEEQERTVRDCVNISFCWLLVLLVLGVLHFSSNFSQNGFGLHRDRSGFVPVPEVLSEATGMYR